MRVRVAAFVLLFLVSLVALVVGTIAAAFYGVVEFSSLEDFVSSRCTILEHATVHVDYKTRRTHQLGYRAVWLVSYRCEYELHVANLTEQTLQGSADEFATAALAMARAEERPIGSSVACWCHPGRIPSAVTEEGKTNNAVVWEEPRILLSTDTSGPALALVPLGILGLILACCAPRLKCCRRADAPSTSRFERHEFGAI